MPTFRDDTSPSETRTSSDSLQENQALLEDDYDVQSDDGFTTESRPSQAWNSHSSGTKRLLPMLKLRQATFHNPRLGKARAYWLGTIVCMGGFLFGYDSGIVGGVLQLPSFQEDFRFPNSSQEKTQSLSVSLQQLGAFLACFAIWPFTSRYGRKWPLTICSFIFCIGALVETINTKSRTVFYIGRVVAGVGLGGSTVVTPMYSAEMAPKELRGQIGCFFQLLFTVGIFTSYWVNYAVQTGLASSSKQWQIPIGLQLVPAGVLGLGVLTLRESVRWYATKEMHDKAWDSLQWIRASNGPEAQKEMEEIRIGVELETRAKEGFQFSELLDKHNFNRLFTAFWIFTAQSSTGAAAFAYFSPQYFKALVGPGDRSLLISGIFGAVKVIACGIFVFALSEKYSRRSALVVGALLMAIFHIITAAINKAYPPPETVADSIPVSAKLTVALIYLFVMVYNGSWGPLPWPYVSEIFPARIREVGIGVGVAAQWLFNFVYTLATPYMIKNLAWGTFLLWGVFNVVIAIFAFFFIHETQGRSLEQINAEYYVQQDTLANRGRGTEEENGKILDDISARSTEPERMREEQTSSCET